MSFKTKIEVVVGGRILSQDFIVSVDVVNSTVTIKEDVGGFLVDVLNKRSPCNIIVMSSGDLNFRLVDSSYVVNSLGWVTFTGKWEIDNE